MSQSPIHDGVFHRKAPDTFQIEIQQLKGAVEKVAVQLELFQDSDEGKEIPYIVNGDITVLVAPHEAHEVCP